MGDHRGAQSRFVGEYAPRHTLADHRGKGVAQYAASRGLPVLATTLASSRWKDLDQVNEAGTEVCSNMQFVEAAADVVETAAASGNRSQQAGLSSNPCSPLLGGTFPSGQLRKREGPAAEGSGRGPAQPDVSGGWLPRNEVTLPSVVFWSQNWRKGGLQPRRNEIVREQCFYNQNWCGCEFSKRQTL